MFYQIFLSPQVKRCMIIGYKFGICQLPQEFLNDLNHSLVFSLLGKIKSLFILAKNS